MLYKTSFLKQTLILLLSLISITSIAKSSITSSLDFIENKGQWEKQVLYKADLKGGWVYLQKNALTFKFIEQTDKHPLKEKNEVVKGHVYKINWLNANPNPTIESTEKQSYYNNYFIGNDEKKWQSNVGNFRSIFYKNVYPNIDIKIYSEATAMKSDYIIHKNGNIQDLQFQYDGIDAINIDKDGKLKITTSINTVYELKPYAYQIIKGKEKEIPCKYLLKNNILSFQTADNNYDKNIDLIIDPTLVFSTYSGSFSDNWGSSATHDNAGNMFLGGIALGDAFPTTTGAFQTNFANGSGSEPTDIVITKFNATGTARLYSTYLGGSSNELLASLICTPANELVAVLTTSSADFPTTTNAYDKTFNGGSSLVAYEISLQNGADLAITKFNADGTALIGSTFFGGTGDDGVNVSGTTDVNYGDESRSDVALDDVGNIYVTTTTSSTDIPKTAGKAQTTYGGGESDGLLAKFNSDLSMLNWASYFGGSDADASYNMAIDKNNNIFICGGTASRNIPGTSNGLNKNFIGGQTDGFIAKFNNNGTSILAATYVGTIDYDQAFIIDLDNSDNVYIFGQTLGVYPVTANVYSNFQAPQFIHKLNNNLNTTGFSTVFGKTNGIEENINITPTAFLVDVCGNIYAVGWGGNVNYSGNTNGMAVTADAFKKTTDGSDFYLINLSANATNLKYATYFGEDGGIGDHVDGGTSRFDKNGIVYQAVCASCGGTYAFPVTSGVVGPDNNSFNCNMAGFKFKFDLTGLQIITTTATPSSGCAPLNVNFTYTSTQPGTGYYWDFGDGTSSTNQYPTHNYSNVGNYTVRFILSDPNNCNPFDSTTLTIKVNSRVVATVNKNICQGQSVTIGNQQFSTAGTYTISIQTTSGCDSIITLNLSVTSSVINAIRKEICQGGKITIGTHTYTQAGNYTDTLRAAGGCDSIVKLNLIVHPNKNNSLTKILCQGQSVTIGNQTFSVSGNYTINLQSSFGCDSIVSLNLMLKDTLVENINRTICKGEKYQIGNQQFNANGNYAIYLRAAAGCDSLVNLSLTVLDTSKSNLIKIICDGDSVKIGNEIFKEAGNYSISLPSSIGCDSLVNLNLQIIEKKRTAITKEICDGEFVTIGNQTFNEAGNYTIVLSSSQHCDSIVNLTLIVNTLPTIIATSDKTSALSNEPIQLNVTTTQILSYNWTPIELLSSSTLQNPIGHIIAPTWFLVTATNDSTHCNTKDSVFVNIEYLPCAKENIFIPNAFTPNGDGINDKFFVRTNILKALHLEIYNRWGNKVFETDDINKGWDGTFKGQPSPLETYGYILKGTCLQGDEITIKGNLTILK